LPPVEGEERRGLTGHGAPGFPYPVLAPGFYARPATHVARLLLGKLLVSSIDASICVGRIVETEAYTGPEDEASHAAARTGRTRRNEAMFGPPGLAYIYRIYGIHWCLNAVTDHVGYPSAVLIRAAEPLEGLQIARVRRPGRPDRDLMRGPGNLCAALGISGALNHHRLDTPPLQIVDAPVLPDELVRIGGRIGVSRAADRPLRFWIGGSPWVSRTS